MTTEDITKLFQFSHRAPGINLEGLSDQGSRVAFLCFHEAYHIGQIALLRRLLGKEGRIR